MATIVVSTFSDSALRTAIANAAAGDIITFSSSGTITLTGGELVINKALTIDAGGNDITIDAGGNSRVFNINDGTSAEVDVVLEGITITGGSVTGDGGGIFNAEDLTVIDSTLSNNEATGSFADGGAIFNDHNGILTLTNSIITGNFADDNGGGVYNNDLGSMTISDSTIDGNTSNFDGGGLFNFGDATIINTTISNNQALSGIADGGGIAVFDDTTITNSTITGNSAGDDGGGVYIKDFVGGKVPTATITGTTIANNTAGSDGGGVFNFGEAIITDSIITQNEAEDKDGTGGGGGIASFGNTNKTSTTVTSSFVAGNADNSDVEFVAGTDNTFVSGDNNQIGKGNAISAFNLTNDETGIMPGVTITELDGSTDITEDGATDTYSVVLDSQPTDDVTVTIAADGESTTDVTTLTFNATNWDVAQTVTVTAVDDTLVEGNHTSTISHTVSGAIEYDGLTVNDVVANITDNDVAGVTITESGGSTDISEDGVLDSYEVVLDAQPTSPVTVTLGTDGQAGFTPNILIFDETNWDTPQSVQVFAFDDNLVEGPHTGTISHTVASSDANFDGLVVDDVVANITDNDTAGVTITESGGSTNIEEGGATDTYEVVLDAQPTDTVTINIAADSESTTDVTTLTFDATNWDTPQTVTVTAVDDGVIEGSHTSTISHTVTSSDANFDGLTVSDVVANITDSSNPILGTSGNDNLIGGSGDDMIDGRGGDDNIEGRTGNDQLFGSGGNDTINGQAGDDQILGGAGLDSLLGGSDNDTLMGEGGADTLIGNEGQDLLLGGNGADRLVGGFDNDTLDGGAGRDFLVGNDGADSFLLRAGDRNDTIADYDDGTDNFLLESIDFTDLTFIQSGANTIIRYTDPVALTSENLATLNGINATVLDSSDFFTI